MKKMVRLLFLALLFVCVAGGCAGYQLGNTLPPGIKSVYIPTFLNRTNEPEIEVRTTSLAIQEFRRDGSIRVVDAEHADARLEVTLLSYELYPLRYERNDARAADEYRLIITAKAVFRMADTGKVLSENIVQGESTFVLSGDLSSAKLVALPNAARDLAHDIVESVVEYWP